MARSDGQRAGTAPDLDAPSTARALHVPCPRHPAHLRGLGRSRLPGAAGAGGGGGVRRDRRPRRPRTAAGARPPRPTSWPPPPRRSGPASGALGSRSARARTSKPAPAPPAAPPCRRDRPPATPWTTRPRPSSSTSCGGRASTGWRGWGPGPDHPLLGIRRAETHALCAALGPRAGGRPVQRRPALRAQPHPPRAAPPGQRHRGRDLVPVLARQAALLADEADLLDELADGDRPRRRRGPERGAGPLARRATRRWLRGAAPHPPTWPRWSGSWPWPGGHAAPPTSPRGCGCGGRAGRCRRRRSARGRPVVSAPDDRGRATRTPAQR